MKIQQAIIAVLVCFMLGLNVAEAAPSKDSGYKQSQYWQQARNHNWHNKLHHAGFRKWYKRWYKKWFARTHAPKMGASHGTVVASLFSNSHHDHNGSSSSGLGGTGLSGGSHGDQPSMKAPEISVASGASAIALLTGLLLLMGERTRTRRF
jgi:hypothetical protein